jgi:hypothetical protein
VIDLTQVEQQSKTVKIMSTKSRLGLSIWVVRRGYLRVYLGQYSPWVRYMSKSPDLYMTQVKVGPARPNPIIGLKGFFLQGQGKFKTHVGKSNSMKVLFFSNENWNLFDGFNFFFKNSMKMRLLIFNYFHQNFSKISFTLIF